MAMIDEDFDADEVLRDMDAKGEMFVDEDEEVTRDVDEDEDEDDGMRELNFGTQKDENANFNDMASDLDTAEDLWE
jgi:hypothetical protein